MTPNRRLGEPVLRQNGGPGAVAVGIEETIIEVDAAVWTSP